MIQPTYDFSVLGEYCFMRMIGRTGSSNFGVAQPEHKVYPYRLNNVDITEPDQVWSTDITYLPMPTGFMYLSAVIDWYSRYILSWALSNTLDGYFCLDARRLGLCDDFAASAELIEQLGWAFRLPEPWTEWEF